MSTDILSVVDQTRYWFGLFSHRRNGVWKGMLQVPLALSVDDDEAVAALGAEALDDGGAA